MKKWSAAILLALLCLTAASCARPAAPTVSPPLGPSAAESPQSSPARGTMTVTSAGIADGVISDEYGSRGKDKDGSMPTRSIPLTVAGAPAGTACFALYMDDPDSEPLCGYRWVHWMAADFTETSLPAGYSGNAGGGAVQGKNDFGATGYGGPTPPDKDHTYVITIYALDAPTGLKEGFSKEEFQSAIEGHVLGTAELKGIYKK